MATSRLSRCCLNRLAAMRLQRTSSVWRLSSNVWRISSNVWRLSSSRAGKTASLTGLDRLQGTVKGLVQGSVGTLVQGTIRNFLQGPFYRLQGRLLALLQVQGRRVQCSVLSLLRAVKWCWGTSCLTVLGYSVGSTSMSLLGYPACVSGKSMQPALNPRGAPSNVWTFHTRPPLEDPFGDCLWCEDSIWRRGEGETNLLESFWAQDWVWVSTRRAASFTFGQGEVVVYVSPKDPYDYLIKRVVALEGDIVSSDRYVTPHVRVPEGHLWLEGDNWGNSVDSNKYGPVSSGLVCGVATRIVWPPSRWASLQAKGLPASLQPERVITSCRMQRAREARAWSST